MLSYEIQNLVYKEQHKDRQRAAEQHQLIKVASLRQDKNIGPVRKVAGWLGPQLVKWGSKLQKYNQVHRQTATQRGS